MLFVNLSDFMFDWENVQFIVFVDFSSLVDAISISIFYLWKNFMKSLEIYIFGVEIQYQIILGSTA